MTAAKIVIATGTTPARPPHVDFDGIRVLDSDQILTLDTVPGSMVVVGAGVIGVEYASMFAALGTRVTLVEKREQMLDFCDPEIVESLKFHLRDHTMSFRFGEEVASVGQLGRRDHHHPGLRARRSPPRWSCTRPAGRATPTPSTSTGPGWRADKRGRLVVNDHYQTSVAAHLRRR